MVLAPLNSLKPIWRPFSFWSFSCYRPSLSWHVSCTYILIARQTNKTDATGSRPSRINFARRLRSAKNIFWIALKSTSALKEEDGKNELKIVTIRHRCKVDSDQIMQNDSVVLSTGSCRCNTTLCTHRLRLLLTTPNGDFTFK